MKRCYLLLVLFFSFFGLIQANSSWEYNLPEVFSQPGGYSPEASLADLVKSGVFKDNAQAVSFANEALGLFLVTYNELAYIRLNTIKLISSGWNIFNKMGKRQVYVVEIQVLKDINLTLCSRSEGWPASSVLIIHQGVYSKDIIRAIDSSWILGTAGLVGAILLAKSMWDRNCFGMRAAWATTNVATVLGMAQKSPV